MRVSPDDFAEQQPLAQAAAACYVDEAAACTRAAIIERSGQPPDVFDRHFTHPEEALTAFYNLLVPQYRLITASTEGFGDFSFEERLASFHYILLDGLAEQRAFVQATFETAVRTRSSLRADLRAALKELLTSADVPNTNRLITGLWPVQAVLVEVTMAVLRFWVADESAEQQATTALVDKLVAFIAELVMFGGVQRGVDLAWYLARADLLGLKRLPVVGRWFGS